MLKSNIRPSTCCASTFTPTRSAFKLWLWRFLWKTLCPSGTLYKTSYQKSLVQKLKLTTGRSIQDSTSRSSQIKSLLIYVSEASEEEVLLSKGGNQKPLVDTHKLGDESCKVSGRQLDLTTRYKIILQINFNHETI